jgi:hypothetical protein
LEFYRSGGSGTWWDGESALLQQGLEWCATRMNGHTQFQYQLHGFELRSIDNNLR